jgi:ferredoxin
MSSQPKNRQHGTTDEKKTPRVLRIIDGCIICRTCEFLAPELFIVKEMALSAEVLVKHPAPEQVKDAHEAIRNCPEHVIMFRRQASPTDSD